MATSSETKISWSDFDRTRTQEAQRFDLRSSPKQATHVHRLLGIVGTGEEIAMLEAILVAGGVPASRLIAQKIEDLIAAALTYLALTVTHAGINAATTYNGGAEVNALSDYMKANETFDQRKQEFVDGAAFETEVVSGAGLTGVGPYGVLRTGDIIFPDQVGSNTTDANQANKTDKAGN